MGPCANFSSFYSRRFLLLAILIFSIMVGFYAWHVESYWIEVT